MATELPPQVIKRVARELQQLQEQACEGIRVHINEQHLSDIQADVEGPVDTPYENGLFRLRLVLPSDFPNCAPKGFFLTKIFHPNVSTSGEICVNVLKKDWTPELGLRHVLMVIRCLLIEPFPESALNEEAGRLLIDDYEEYAKHARLMTSIHAQPRQRATPLTTSGANAGAQNPSETKKDETGLPVAKKPKADQKSSAAACSKMKKTLKRL